MKLQIDTKAKTIKVDENVKFDALIKVLNKLLPKEWKEYTLESGVIQWYWYNPIPYTNTSPWRIGSPIYTTCGDTVGGDIVTTSVYNIDV